MSFTHQHILKKTRQAIRYNALFEKVFSLSGWSLHHLGSRFIFPTLYHRNIKVASRHLDSRIALAGFLFPVTVVVIALQCLFEGTKLPLAHKETCRFLIADRSFLS